MSEIESSAMRHALARLARAEDLPQGEMIAVFREIMTGACDPAQIGGLLVGLACKGERTEEIVGAATVMREAVVRIPTTRTGVLDTCGTGGSGVARRNVSTAVAIAVAACGVPVAKHGNRSSGSPCGSADVLEALGVALDTAPEQVGRMIDRIGIGFLFAPALHPAMKHAADVRRSLGVRTIFNLLGPLTNPALAKRQMLGVYDPRRCRDLAAALAELGSERVLVVHGFRAGVTADDDAIAGIDDASTEGATLVWELFEGTLSRRVVTPEDAGLPRVPLADLAGEDPASNAEALLRLLEGETGPYRTAVQLSGALALLAASDAGWDTLPDHAGRIAAVLDDGRARTILAELLAGSHDGARTP
jgi:anthranilate phosphoribosyltransferase